MFCFIVLNMSKLFFIITLISICMSCVNSEIKKFESDVFKTDSGKTVSITFIKHASLMIDFEGYFIHVDPVNKQDDMRVDYELFPKANLVLVTHEHYDHLDNETVEIISTKETKFFSTENAVNQLGYGNVVEVGDSFDVDGKVKVEVVPAYNVSPEQLQFHPKERGDVGYVIDLDGLRIYVAGDTENIAEMSNLKDIDIAFLPVNQPYTMKVQQAVDAVLSFEPKVFYPYHYSATNVEEIADKLKDSNIEVRIRQMQ